MEKNLRGIAIPCICSESDGIKSGLMVYLAADSSASDYGEYFLQEKKAAALPTTSGNAALSFYVAEWAVSNDSLPIYETLPSYTWARRQGFDRTPNLPATDITVRMTHPRDQQEQTVPSGQKMLAYDEGIYTITSGCYSFSSTPTVGTALGVHYDTGNYGKLGCFGDSNVGVKVATCLDYDSTHGTIVFKTTGVIR